MKLKATAVTFQLWLQALKDIFQKAAYTYERKKIYWSR
jgi:hypothetical protein